MFILIDKVLDRLPGSGAVYLVAFAVGLSAAASNIAKAAPADSFGQGVVAWLVRVAAWASAAADIYRRGTEVAAERRGFRS